MKTLIISALGLFISQASFADCINLTGSYTLVDDQTLLNLTVVQDKCKSVSIDYNDSINKTYLANKKVYLTNETDELKVFESAELTHQELLAKVEFYYKAKNASTTAVSHFFLDEAGDLHGEFDYYKTDGTLYHQDKPVYKRNDPAL